MYSWGSALVKGIETIEISGMGVRTYRDRPLHLLDMLQKTVTQYKHKIAFIEDEKQITFGEFDQITTVWAQKLSRNYKVGKGDRVVLLLKNTIGFCTASFSVLKTGGIVVPLNTKLKMHEWGMILKRIQPSLLIVDDDLVTSIKRELNLSVPVITESEWSLEGANPDHTEGQEVDFPPVNEQDPAFILFTSGTTGEPKGAALSHFNITHAALNYERCYGLTCSDTTIIAVPIFHGTGLFAQFTAFVYLGGTIVLLKTFDPVKMLDLCEKYEVTHTIVVPTIYTMLLNTPSYQSYSLRFRVLGSGGAPLPEILLKKITEWLPGVKLINTYGLTEATSPAVIMPYEKAAEKIGSVGIPSPVTECTIVNPETGEELPPNQTGELLLKGPIIIQGYWNNNEATKNAFLHGWLKTGDVAMQDEDGFIYIKDRLKNMINRGGEKIYCIEVENVLFNHPKILEAALVGVEDPIYGEALKAVVVLKPNETITENEISEWCTRYLAKYKVPQYIQIKDSLPRNAGGKVIKKELI